MSNKNGLSAVSCSSYLDQRLFIARSLGQVLLLTLTPPEVGKSLVKLSRVSILISDWLAVYGSVDGEKLRLGLDEEKRCVGFGPLGCWRFSGASQVLALISRRLAVTMSVARRTHPCGCTDGCTPAVLPGGRRTPCTFLGICS